MSNRAAIREADRIHSSKFPEALSASLSRAAQRQAQDQEQSRIGDERAQAWYRVESAWKSWRDHSDAFAAALDSDNVPDAEAGSYAAAVLKFREAISESPWVDLWKAIPGDDPRFQGALELLRGSSFATIQTFALRFNTPSLGTRGFKQHIGMFPNRLWIVFEREVSRYDLERAGVRQDNEPQEACPFANLSMSGQKITIKSSITDLREFARTELRGQERAVIEALCKAEGSFPIPDLAVNPGVDWNDHFQGFKDAQRRLNPKLKEHGWRLVRRSNAGLLVRVGAKEGAK